MPNADRGARPGTSCRADAARASRETSGTSQDVTPARRTPTFPFRDSCHTLPAPPCRGSWRRLRGSLLHRRANDVHHCLHVCQYIVIPESQYTKSAFSEINVALCVVRSRRCVLSAIQFDDQTHMQASKIGDVGPDWMLSAEAMPIQVSSAEMPPQMALCLRCIATKSAGEVQLVDAIDIIGHGRAGPPQPSAAPPARGSGDESWRSPLQGERGVQGSVPSNTRLVGAEHRGGCCNVFRADWLWRPVVFVIFPDVLDSRDDLFGEELG